MIIPISHEETRVRRLPWVTFGIMALCTATLVLMDLRGDEHSYERFGLVPANPGLLGLGSHMFVHAGWGHLIGNLLILFLAGPPLEDRWGRPLFAGFYLAAGVFAGAVYVLMSSGSNLPMVGASGAVAALMGASVLRFWSTRIRFFYIFWALRFFSGTFWAPVWAMLPIWFVSQLAMIGVSSRLGVATGVAYWCHVGGFVFGTGVAFAMRHWQIEEKFLHGVLDAKVTVSHNPVIDEAMDLRIQGDAEGAYELLRAAAEEQGDDPDIVSAYWELACELRRADDAVPQMVVVMKQGFSRGDLDLAVRCWTDIADRASSAEVDRQTLVRLVPLLVEREEERRAVQTLREIVASERGPLSTGMAFRVLDMAKDLDPPTALVAARRALEIDDLPDAKRERIQAVAEKLRERCKALPTIAASNPEPGPAETVTPGEGGTQGMGIPLEYEPVYDFALPSQSEESTDSMVRELDASGSLVESDSAAELSDDSEPHELMAVAPALPNLASAPTAVTELEDGTASYVDLPMPKPLSQPVPGGRAFDSSVHAPLPDSPLPDPILPAPMAEAPAEQLALEASASMGRFFGVKVIEAVPVDLGDDKLVLQRPDGKRARIAYRAISALSVAAVGGLGSKPILIIDLILNWDDPTAEQLQLIRLRSDAFDVRSLISSEMRSVDAFRALQEQLLARTDAQPVPDRDAVRGRPFRKYADIDRYQREVLEIQG